VVFYGFLLSLRVGLIPLKLNMAQLLDFLHLAGKLKVRDSTHADNSCRLISVISFFTDNETHRLG
jgi:hypothetical protein